jgi:opacity protein-like surface antigen
MKVITRSFALILAAIPLASQPFGLQFKAGIPVTDFDNSEYLFRAGFAHAWSNRYLIGPAVEFRLPRRFSVEFDALYERIHLTGYVQQVPIPNSDRLNAHGGAWLFPLLVKFHVSTGPIAVFVSAGPSARWLKFSGEVQEITLLPALASSTSSLHESHGRVGFATGGGVDIHVKGMRVSPEIRYSYFGGDINCGSCRGVQPFTGLNSVAVMLGVGF